MHLPLQQLTGLLAIATSACALAGPHEHGVAHLNLAIEAQSLEIAVKVPLESLLGYERAPRSDAEKREAAALLERFKKTQPVLALPAHCKEVAPAQVKAPLIEGQAGSAHGDLEAVYKLQCTQTSDWREIDVTLFDVARRISRVKAQIVGPQGQTQSVLRRNKRQLKIGR